MTGAPLPRSRTIVHILLPHGATHNAGVQFGTPIEFKFVSVSRPVIVLAFVRIHLLFTLTTHKHHTEA